MSLFEVCRWLDSTPFATAFRESRYMYPVVEGSHVLGLALSVGTVMWFDLRLIGATMRRHTVSEVFRSLQPWMIVGFAVMVATGALLFASHAAQAYQSVYFRIKLVLLCLTVVNVVIFHSTIDLRRAEWEEALIPPLQARIAGAVSLLLWVGVIAAGRLMAYHFT
jgi:hypothetical protein